MYCFGIYVRVEADFSGCFSHHSRGSLIISKEISAFVGMLSTFVSFQNLSCVPQYILMSWWNQYHVAWIKFPLTLSYWESRITYMVLSIMTVTQCPTWGTSMIIVCLFWKNNMFDNSVKESSDLIVDLSSIIIARWWISGQDNQYSLVMWLCRYRFLTYSILLIQCQDLNCRYYMSHFNSRMYDT